MRYMALGNTNRASERDEYDAWDTVQEAKDALEHCVASSGYAEVWEYGTLEAPQYGRRLWHAVNGAWIEDSE